MTAKKYEKALSSTRRVRRAAFSLVELMVVIAIIAVLVGLLLVALVKVKTAAAITETENTMRNFAAACDQFYQQYGRYPGAIPESVLLAGDPGPISGTENALLELMGGFRVRRPGDLGTPVEDEFNAYVSAGATSIPFGAGGWSLAINRERIGEGPVINGKASEAFLAPDSNAYGIAAGQRAAGFTVLMLPDLLDAWGQPIIYLRRVRERGPIVSADNDPDDRPQFLLAGVASYLEATASSGGGGLGNLQEDQVYDASNNSDGSILSESVGERMENLAYILRQPGLVDTNNPDVYTQSTARGSYMILSAGPDGIFFSAEDGPGAPGDAVTDLSTTGDPDRAVQEYDDLRSWG